MRIGFVGLGSQGAPMARRLIEDGHQVALWARRPQTLEPFADTAATVADSLTELGTNSDVVCICVVGDADVDDVVAGTGGVLQAMAPGGLVVIHSTVHPDTCRVLSDRAAVSGIDVVDAPVSGGGVAATARELLVMVGSTREAFTRCQPVFASYSNCVRHLGPVGSGQIAKLLNNTLLTAHLATAITTLEVGEQMGIATTELAELLSHGSARSHALSSIADAGGTLARIAAVAGRLLQKDIRLMVDLAQQSGVTPGAVLVAADCALAKMGHPR